MYLVGMYIYPYITFSVFTLFGIILFRQAPVTIGIKLLVSQISCKVLYVLLFFNKRYKRSNDVTTGSYKACWSIKIVYLSFSPSRWSRPCSCSAAMDCTSHLTLYGLVIWYEGKIDVLYSQPSITYSYLQDVQHNYRSLKIGKSTLEDISWISIFHFGSLLMPFLHYRPEHNSVIREKLPKHPCNPYFQNITTVGAFWFIHRNIIR